MCFWLLATQYAALPQHAPPFAGQAVPIDLPATIQCGKVIGGCVRVVSPLKAVALRAYANVLSAQPKNWKGEEEGEDRDEKAARFARQKCKVLKAEAR
jgi:hypothetical protein